MADIIEKHIVPVEVKDVRLSDYIYPAMNSFLSRKSSIKAIKGDRIFVDGVIGRTGTWVKPGQSIELYDSEDGRKDIFSLKLHVVYEDEHLAVIKKPAGYMVNGNAFRTVENALPGNLTASQEKDSLKFPRPVHRLDKPVAGLLITAKTSKALMELNRQFAEREIHKRYRAIVIGKLEGEGVIKEPLEGKVCETKYLSVKHYRSLKNEWLTLMDLWPVTGRMHQLRIHLSMKGYPILGDSLYGVEGEILKSKGIFLESVEISFRHPEDNREMDFSVGESAKFKTYPERDEKRWGKYNN